jgi:hypothetical protein
MAGVVGLAIAAACWQSAARFFGLPPLRASQALPESFWTRANLHKNAAVANVRFSRPRILPHISDVYPYSVVPGGFRNAEDLQAAVAGDSVVRRHYSHFDFSRAHLIRATEAREVYLSYRIRNAVFWTRRKYRLRIGELLLTDGKITARARCGNQVSETAKPEVSDDEPDQDVLDNPVAAVATPSMPARPMLAPPDLPVGQPNPPQLFSGGFFFPYVPVGVPLTSGICRYDNGVLPERCKPKHKKPVVPEPPTIVLLASGLAMIGWRYRKIVRPVAA